MSRRIYLLVTVLVSILALYEVANGIYVRQTTGLLEVTSKSSAQITISQANHQSVNAGTGSVKVRLKPGSYEVIATDGRDQAIKTVQVQKTTKTQVALSLIPTEEQATISEKTKNSNLLTQLLPFVGPKNEYRITYVYSFQDKTSQATIIINAPTDQAKQDALGWIKSEGFDPNSLNLSYSTVSSE